MNRPILTATLIALASPTLAGGIAGGYDAPRGSLDFSVGRSHGPDRDRIGDNAACSRILCPRPGSDWWEKREKSRDLLKKVAKPGGGIPETPSTPTSPETPVQPPSVTPEPQPPAPVPLPAGGLLLAAALAGLMMRRRG